MPKLYLIPNLLGEDNWENVLPARARDACQQIKHFIVEDTRTARRFLKKLDKSIDIDTLTFYELNKFTSQAEKEHMLDPLLAGADMGIITEAGCPGIADPGAEVVALAHKKNIRVVPLVGPSSILLALMASGLNGQNFAFNGYLPVKQAERTTRIRQLEKRAQTEKQTQIFIETPYRNNQLAADILQSCQANTQLCIACNLTLDDEFISTKPISAWKNHLPDLDKKPAIFLIY
jgi:16S rRNA (cytidine1402-2'-O)-methyltransferase